MSTESDRLEALKARMSETQRKDMAELLSNELRSREMQKRRVSAPKPTNVRGSRLDTSLQTDDIKDIYTQVHQRLRQPKAERPRAERPAPKMPAITASAAQMTGGEGNSMRSLSRPATKNIVLFLAIVTLATAKIFISSGTVKASAHNPATATAASPAALTSTPTAMSQAPSQGKTWSEQEKQLLTELDARRVELEKRKEALDQREQAVVLQERELSTRLIELRTLSRKVGDANMERDQRQEARMEQLSNVYGSMAPNEAAPLVAKLDEELALNLLQRMPGKRMGQILSLMDPSRAVELTKRLTEQRSN